MDINFRLDITKLFKDNILRKINPILNDFTNNFNRTEDQVCTMYGGYSYLSLMNKLESRITCNTEDDIEINQTATGDFFLNCPLEDTLLDLNMIIIIKKDISSIIHKCNTLCQEIETQLKEYTFTIKEERSRKLFDGITISLIMEKTKVYNTRSKREREEEAFKHTIFTIDIYTEKNINIRLFKNLIYNNQYRITTLTKEGFIILSSFVYYESIIQINKKRTDNIIRLFLEEDEAFESVKKCQQLFKDYDSSYSKSAFLLKQFLISFKKNDNESGLTFDIFESEVNNSILETLIFNKKYSLRQIINSFIYETDLKLQLLDGRFLKTGGEAYRRYSEEDITNDIDTKIFLKKYSKNKESIIYQNIISSLFFIIDHLNKLENIPIGVDFKCNFSGKNLVYNIDEKPNYLDINYDSNTNLLQLSYYIDSEFKVEEFTFKDKFRSSPLDIWVYKEDVVPNTPLDDLFISREYFMKDLEESLPLKSTNKNRILRRYYKGKLKKDKDRYDYLTEEKNQGFLNEQPEFLSNVSGEKDMIFIKNIVNLIWDNKYKGYLRQYDVCGCINPIPKNPRLCELSFIKHVKCNFINNSEEDNIKMIGFMKGFMPQYKYNNLFHLLLLLITKLNETEFGKNKVVISFDPNFYKEYEFDRDNTLCSIDSEKISYKDITYLIWYTSNTNQYKLLNEKIREGEQLSFNETLISEKLKSILDLGIIKGSIENPIILYRGLNTTIEKMSEMSKIEIETPLSTTLDEYVSYKFTGGETKKCCIMKIILKSEVKGIYLPIINVGMNFEKEVLLRPGIVLKYKENFINKEGYKIFVYEYSLHNEEQEEKMVVDEKPEDENYRLESYEEPEEKKMVEVNADQDIDNITQLNELIDRQNFMKKYLVSKAIYKKDQMKKFIIDTNERKLKFFKFNRDKFEKIFSDFCIKYLKEYENIDYNFSTLINSTLTLEKESVSKQTTIRQLLNTFISTINCLLKNYQYGKLYKTGGESIRYYTKTEGDKISNDIDSKFCCYKGRNPKKTIQEIFQIIAYMMILLAQAIKSLDFTTQKYEIENIGYVTSFEKVSTLIQNYIVVRTNYVGKCFPDKGGSKGNEDCMNIISLDINNRIVLDKLKGLFDGNIIELYVYAAPYDFLFSNKACCEPDIQERKDEKLVSGKPLYFPCLDSSLKPPVVSLYFIIKDLINLLTPPDFETKFPKEKISSILKEFGSGDLEKRIDTGKHKKDINRYKGFMKIFEIKDIYTEETDQDILNRIYQLLSILEGIKKGKVVIDSNIGTEALDQICSDTSNPCYQLKKYLIHHWDLFITKSPNFDEKILDDSLILKQILSQDPGPKRTVTI